MSPLFISLSLPGSEVISSFSSSSSISSSISSMAEPVVPEVPPASWTEKPSVVDFSYVGIDAILEQMRRKAMKQGFELNIMVVGESLLAKHVGWVVAGGWDGVVGGAWHFNGN